MIERRASHLLTAAVLAGFTALVSAQQPPASGAQQPASGAQPPALAPVVIPMPQILKEYTGVTADRLKRPSDDDWLMVRRTYDGWGYSPLNQITPGNARKLVPVWSAATGAVSGHEATPIVSRGVMFVSTPGNQVMALNARTGDVLWRYRNPSGPELISRHLTNRGVALYQDKVYLAEAECVVVALDAKTGKKLWSSTVGDNRLGYYMSLAPLVADGKVIVGASGGELGIRGFVAALDAETGAPLWKVFTVPAPGEPGSETWPTGDQWKTGGGSIWVTGNYDAETNITYWGTGNGGPWMGDQRPGDNLFTASTIAIDVATGKMVGHHQYNPNESWDWDEVSPPILVDFRRNGRTVKGLIDVARDGYMWFLERTPTKINFVDAKPYVKQNAFRGVDPTTGRANVDPERQPGTGKRAEFCPSFWGGKNWPPIAYSPKTRMIYIPANENLCSTITGRPVEDVAGQSFTGALPTLSIASGADHVGEVQAWNVDTGQRVWMHPYKNSPTWGPMLATGGGLVFTGGTNDRKFHAFDAANGKLLWEFGTSSGIVGQPSSFAVDGKQYVAVQSGWGVDSASMQGRLNALVPGAYPPVPEGGAIWVFALAEN